MTGDAIFELRKRGYSVTKTKLGYLVEDIGSWGKFSFNTYNNEWRVRCHPLRTIFLFFFYLIGLAGWLYLHYIWGPHKAKEVEMLTQGM